MTLVQVAFVLIFASEQLCTAEYVVYGRKMTLDDNLSLNPNQCHYPLITQHSHKAMFSGKKLMLAYLYITFLKEFIFF